MAYASIVVTPTILFVNAKSKGPQLAMGTVLAQAESHR